MGGGSYGGGPGPLPPQYPPQTYNGSPYAYDPTTGFASVGRCDHLYLSLVLDNASVILAHHVAAPVRSPARRASPHFKLQGRRDGLITVNSRLMLGTGSPCRLSLLLSVCLQLLQTCCILYGSCTMLKVLTVSHINTVYFGHGPMRLSLLIL
jgi:hypothetical protein